jgi:hypothetical protein
MLEALVRDAPHMNTRVRVQIGFWLAALVASNAAYACPACGDKLNFGSSGFERMNRKSEPGRVVLLGARGSPLRVAEGLQAALQRDGHQVTSIDRLDDLQRAVAEHGADVVVVHWRDAAAAEERLARVDAAPTVVPVAYARDDATDASAAGVESCLERLDQRSGRKVVASIDKVLEQRRKGVSSACVVKIAGRAD